MTKTLTHRGPDDEGSYISGSSSFGMGFRRLAIIDLENGVQPMSDGSGSIWVSLNGEIYNFRELRDELSSHGHEFRTQSDTEVVVNGYKQWGVEVLQRLNGMFGLAVWDDEKQQLLLARDRLGIKPVYYKIDSGSATFGSEIRPLLAVTKEKPRVDLTAVNLFFRYRYTPAPRTVFAGIHKLAAGTRLILKKNRPPIFERWWDYKPRPFRTMPSIQESEEALLQLYRSAVRRHLISDVPVGLLLSGGHDSALLLALMSEIDTCWKTYTVGFGGGFDGDELDDAAAASQALGSTNIGVQVNRKSFEEGLTKVVGILEEPVTADSVVPMYFLCRRIKEDLKVVLMGQGPDELFGGYIRHLGLHYGPWWRLLPSSLKKVMGLAAVRLPRTEKLRRGFVSLDVRDRMERYKQVFSILPGRVINQLFRDNALPDDFDERLSEVWQDLEPLIEETDELGGFQFVELRSSLPDELLMYTDKVSMANSLEVRVPYLDYEIVEFVERLSASFKVRMGARKWLHRRVCHRLLGNEFSQRRKLGFETPSREWLSTSQKGDMSEYLLDKESLMYEFLRPEAVQELLKSHRLGRSDHSDILFSLVVFELWMRQYTS